MHLSASSTPGGLLSPHCCGFRPPNFAIVAPERGHHFLVSPVLRPVNGLYRIPTSPTPEYQKCHMFLLLLVFVSN